ncbi:NAD(P)-dependent oxidoreductase [Sphingomonas sanguinis]|jgi:dTDP-6-deoxy-L-talose 4-dehydrogenase (NAD+)|uniref:NAD-dependent epimerase/dehydratase family protein n=1 Tax=Sphingomonas sp. LC-1 TaxID=3110957 RepID=UPI0021BAA037|nr:NAD(P)-dependent oxidoreductase [Sphingomonas sp. LC-1]MCT8003874.1 NAD(P)-dependent oxidoreductase [Sphingomonas sp. LC-1]
MTIAVTGAAGFIGSHVVQALVARGKAVVGIVRRPPIRPIPGLRYVQLDLAMACTDSFQAIGAPDALIHLAWGGLPHYRSLHHVERELPLQYAFLAQMVRAGLQAVTVAGTCYEYGMVDGELDEAREARPDNPYAFAKVALLRQLQFLQTETPFALNWARLFYMWGAGQAATSIYPLLQAAIDRGDATFPMSAGEQLRDYLRVEEVAGMIVDLALGCGNHGVVNISSGTPISIRTLVERWIAERDASIVPQLGHYPYPNYEPLAFWGSAAKRRAILGY